MRARRMLVGAVAALLGMAAPAVAQSASGDPLGWAVIGAGRAADAPGVGKGQAQGAGGQGQGKATGQSGAWVLAASSPDFAAWAQRGVQARQNACHEGKAGGRGLTCANRDVFVVRSSGQPVDVDLSLRPGRLHGLPAEATLFFRARVDARGAVELVQPLYAGQAASEQPLADFVVANLRVASTAPGNGTMQVFGAATALFDDSVVVTLAGAWTEP